MLVHNPISWSGSFSFLLDCAPQEHKRPTKIPQTLMFEVTIENNFIIFHVLAAEIAIVALKIKFEDSSKCIEELDLDSFNIGVDCPPLFFISLVLCNF